MNTSAGSTLIFDAVGMVYPDGTEALQDISFTVSPGEFVTVAHRDVASRPS